MTSGAYEIFRAELDAARRAEYHEARRARMIDGTAGAMEALMWFYAKGKSTFASARCRDRSRSIGSCRA